MTYWFWTGEEIRIPVDTRPARQLNNTKHTRINTFEHTQKYKAKLNKAKGMWIKLGGADSSE